MHVHVLFPEKFTLEFFIFLGSECGIFSLSFFLLDFCYLDLSEEAFLFLCWCCALNPLLFLRPVSVCWTAAWNRATSYSFNLEEKMCNKLGNFLGTFSNFKGLFYASSGEQEDPFDWKPSLESPASSALVILVDFFLTLLNFCFLFSVF